MRQLSRLEKLVAVLSGCLLGSYAFPGFDPLSVIEATIFSVLLMIGFAFIIWYVKNDGGISW